MISLLSETLVYAQSHAAELLNSLGEHLFLVAVALGISTAVSLPLGIWTSRSRTVSVTVINIFNGLRVIPSIAILFLAIPVRELELLLDPNVATSIDPSCTGFSNGMITVAIGNGQPAFQYDFNDGNGFVNENVLSNLPAGS